MIGLLSGGVAAHLGRIMTQTQGTDPEMSETPTQPTGGFVRHLPLLIILGVAVVGSFVLRDYLGFDTLRDNRVALLAYRDSHFLLMAVGFTLIYVAIVAFSLPGAAVASVTGGFLFGLAAGSILNITAATIGAGLIFVAARWGLGATLSARIDASDGRLSRIRDGLRENEVSVLLLMRLVPAVPFFVANLLPALVGVRFATFMWTTAVGIIPGGVVYTWIGVGVGEVFDRGDTPDLSLLWEPHVIGPILGLCLLAALPMILKALRGSKEG